MQLVAIDMTAPLRAALTGRLQEAARQAGLQRVAVVEADPINLDGVAWDKTIGCLIGPGCGTMIREIISKLGSTALRGKIGIALDRETYLSEAVSVYRLIGKPVLCETDIAQLATFVVDCESAAVGRTIGIKQRRIIGLTQFTGGVGTSTLAVALAHHYVKQKRSAVLMDMDDVNPSITLWGQVGASHRAAVADALRRGSMSADRVRDMIFVAEGFDQRLCIVGQPNAFHEGFHLKANVLDGAPSSTEFVNGLFAHLGAEFDYVIVDFGRSWGVGMLAALPWCDKIGLVVDDDALSLRRSLDALRRFRDESGDAEEFNLARWSIVCNRFTGKRLAKTTITEAIDQTGLFQGKAPLRTVAYSARGRQWAAPGSTFLRVADSGARKDVELLARFLDSDGHADRQLNENDLPWWRQIFPVS